MKNVQIICEKYKIYFHAGITKCLICQLNQIGKRKEILESPKGKSLKMNEIGNPTNFLSLTILT